MQMSASYYGAAELDRATHVHRLVKGDDIEVGSDVFLELLRSGRVGE
jgi:beta-galactosidase